MHHHLKWILISLLGFSSATFAQTNVPTNHKSVKPALHLRAFKSVGDWTYIGDIAWEPDSDGNFEKAMISLRRKFPNHYSAGVYLANTWGEHHGQDWLKDPQDNQWKWRDVESKTEFNVGALVQKKWSLSPKITLEGRVTYEYHLTNDMGILKVRPGVSYQMSSNWMSYFRYEAYFPLNFSTATLYKQGYYLGAMYSGISNWLMGPFVRHLRHEWNNTPMFKTATGTTYRMHEDLLSLGLSFNVYF
tara:strand:- start:36631 stop:37368 length:738 start_codon:yes stop_codon:yes gene_type:complete